MAKEVDFVSRIHILKSFALTFAPFHLIGLFLPINILWATVAWLVCTPVAARLSDGVGECSANGMLLCIIYIDY